MFLDSFTVPLSFAIFNYLSFGSKTTKTTVIHSLPLKTRRDIVPLHSSSGSTTSSTHIDCPDKLQETDKVFEGLHEQLEKTSFRTQTRSHSFSASLPGARGMSIDILPDEVLLRIFDFYRKGRMHKLPEWRDLRLVCGRWHQLIISSPRRLHLYLRCARRTPVRKNLGLWPTFPIIIDYVDYPNHNTQKCPPSPDEEEDIFAALEHPDRISCLKLPVTKLLSEKVAAVAQEQFPILTELSFVSGKDKNVSALPSEFLGGCAPRLRQIILEGIPFPTLPTHLSSATKLFVLTLKRIPHTGYISPEAMVASLALSTRLVVLYIEFHLSTSLPDRSDTGRRVATPSQVVLPDLTFFIFRGAGKYLEDLVAQIEAPRLKFFNITYLPVDQLTFSEHELPSFDGHVTRSRVRER